ncbi:hypothetical protein [Absidia glauca]|uniref:Uncharacterized protein n=1 Tax=Absidia glauca TaxID=4829 RepID=A0A163IZE7_ABSGL|nr:hypothetical protein [Absidia glauca]
MTLIGNPHYVEHHRMLTLRQHLELVQSDNQQVMELKQGLENQKEQSRMDLYYLEKKLKVYLKENDTLYSTQQRLKSELYAKDQDLDALNSEVLYWKRLYMNLDKTMCTEREEFARQQDLWTHRESQLAFRLRRLQDSHPEIMDTTMLAPYLLPSKDTFVYDKEDFLPPWDNHYDPPLSPPHQSKSQPSPPITTPHISNLLTVPSLQKGFARLGLEAEQQQTLPKQLTDAQSSCLVNQVGGVLDLGQSSMENDETSQLMLKDKTSYEDCILDSYVQVRSNDISPKHLGSTEPQDRLPLEKRNHRTNGQSPLSRQARKLSLKNELSKAMLSEHRLTLFSEVMIDEIMALEDTNEAYKSYINNILKRIMNDRHTESILSIDPPEATATLKIIPSTLARAHCMTSISPSQQVESRPTTICKGLGNSVPLMIPGKISNERFNSEAS